MYISFKTSLFCIVVNLLVQALIKSPRASSEELDANSGVIWKKILSFLIMKNRTDYAPCNGIENNSNCSCLISPPCDFRLCVADNTLSGQLAVHTFTSSCYFNCVTKLHLK